MLKLSAVTVFFGAIFTIPAVAGPISAPALPALYTLPVGTVLMFDALPELPPGWEKCGYIRVSQGDDKGGEKHDHEYLCIHKVK